MATALPIYSPEWIFKSLVSDRFAGLVTQVLTGLATYDPPNVASGAATPITTVTVTGAVVGYPVWGTFSLDQQGLHLNAWVSAANIVSVNFLNLTGGAINLASGTLTAYVVVP